jgi:hypothetical protein
MNCGVKLCIALSEESEDRFSICAPIPTKSMCYLPITVDLHQANYKETLLENYKKMHSEYVFTSRSEIIVKRTLAFAELAREFKHYPLEKLLCEISCEMMLSEIEITVFSIYLNRFMWPERPNCLFIMLYVLGLAAKSYFLSDLECISRYIDAKIPGFLGFYNTWTFKNNSLLAISLTELNKCFELLTKIPFDIAYVEYNYYVDSILENAPASVYKKPFWSEFTILEPADGEPLPDQPLLVPSLSMLPGYCKMPDPPFLISAFSISSNPSFELI